MYVATTKRQVIHDSVELDEQQPLADRHTSSEQTRTLPPYDQSLSIRIGPVSRTVIDLILNGAITICTEVLGYIHTVSLRWALHRQGRLRYSSNLRLFTQANNSAANIWYVNGVSSAALIITYTAASQVLLVVADPRYYSPIPARGVMVNGMALLVMAFGLLTQAGIAHLCFYQHGARIPTWSSNVLTITLACLQTEPRTRHRDQRCMLSTHATKHTDCQPTQPQTVQPSLRMTDPSAHYVLLLVWLLCPAVVAWTIGTSLTNLNGWPDGFTSVYLTTNPAVSLLCGTLLIGAMQIFATLGLHSVEMLVNRSRDEVTWRHAYPSPRDRSQRESATGAPKAYNSIRAAATSWQSVGLYLLKPIIHWLFGNSVSELYGDDTGYVFGLMDPPYTAGLAGGALVVAVFATVLAWHRPKGAIPSTWGHIQTLADLIDDWGVGKVEKLYWGDKGRDIRDGIRHAGTSERHGELGKIRMDALYSGQT
ncbi:hypothetical protein LTR95_006401 [Oleoguttula sp. CCFEE 5521]